ncbi:hypothetical protein [Fusobacterium sp.]|uniref:hypothetical protein n=1 Tax=Fusobacterium sp. TaxID=68766 RepID=UPI0029050BF5|nr:hypothetical protein [Fusobacterium sp.]MDU1912108.1 hypothetical protein [Fusobacterium sp.]
MNKKISEKALKRALKRKISFTFSLFIVFLITGMITSAFEIADTKDEKVIEQRLENEDQNYQIFFNYEYLKSGKSKDRTKKEFAETIREVNKYYQKENGSNFGKDKVVGGNGVVVGTYNSTSGSKETEVERKVEATKLEYLSIESAFSINPIITNPDIEKNTPEFKIEYPKISIMDKPLCIFPTIPITVNVKKTQPIEVNSIENVNISIVTPVAPNEKIVTIALPTTPKGYDIITLNPPTSPKMNAIPVITVLDPVDITFQGTGFAQGTGIRFNGSQGIAAMNFDSYSTTGIEITANETKVSWIGTMTAGGSSNLPLNSSYNFTNFNTFISDVLDHNVEVTGNYIMKSTATSKFPMFISLNPYQLGISSSSDKTFDFKGTLTLHGPSSANGGGILGIEHQLLAGGTNGTTAIENINSGKTTSILKNSGVIDLYSGYNMIGIMIDTEYFNNNQNSYFKKRPQTRNDGTIKISEGAFSSIGIDFGYYLVKNATNLRGPNSDVYLGNIEIDGQQSYGYRQKYYGNQYYDMVTFNGSNGIITVRGSQNVGISIAEGLSTGDPIANAQSMQVEVGGNQNIGFLRNEDTSAANSEAMVLDGNKIGNTFDFLSTATQSTLIRSDIYEVILDKDLTVTTAGEKNSIMQAGGTGKVTLNDGRSIDANMDQFYALTAGDFLSSAGAKAENRGTINIKGTESIGMAVAAGNAGANSGDINYIGDKGTLIYNLGNFSITKGTLNISGSESKALFNQNGTISITNSNLNINASNGATGISSFGGYIFSTIGKNLKIAVDDTASLTSKGIAVYAGEGAEIILRAAEIEVKEGAAGVAAFDAGTSIDLTGAELKYSGEGYAAYSDGFGTINLTNASIILEGKATGVELNLLDPKVTLNNTTITMMSNDATVANLKNATGLLSNNLKTTVEGSLGLGVSIIDGSNGSGGFYDKYKIATVDGGDLTFDADMDKYSQVDTTDGYFYSRRFLGQRLQLNVDTGVTVTAETDTAYAAEYFGNQVVGLEMSSSSFATSATDAQINLAANSKVIADRIDKGTGAIGLYINFGKINIAGGAKVEVEKGANVVNDNGIGIYAVNGSTVVNAGDIEVAGKEAIGILGMAYRENSLNSIIVDEFGTGGIFADQGKVNITNSKNIALNGTGTIGIYGYNNNSTGVKGDVLITNTASGVVTVGNSSSSNAAIGIYGDKATISNQGTVSVGDGGVAIYAKKGTEVTDLGTLDLGADGVGVMLDGTSDLTATAVTVTSNNTGTFGKTAIFYNGTGAETKDINVAVNASALDKGTAIYAEDMSVVSSGILSIGTSGVGIYVKGTAINTGTNKGIISLEIGKTGAVGMYTKTANIINDTTIGIINVNDSSQIGMYTEGTNAKAINKGTINLNTDDSTGIYVKSGAVTELDAGNNIVFNGKSSVGVFAENSSVNFKDNFTFSNTNENKNIYVYGKGATVGIDAGKTIIVNGVAAPSTAGNKTVGIYLENAGTSSTFNGTTGQLAVTNEAVGIYSKDNNTLNVNVTAAGEKTTGVFIDGASTITGTVTATGSSTAGAVGVYGSGGVVHQVLKI